MALQKTIDLTGVYGSGFADVENAFVFVEDIRFRRNNPPPGWTATARLTIWTSKADKDLDTARPIDTRSVSWAVPANIPTTNLIDWVEDEILSNADFSGGSKVND